MGQISVIKYLVEEAKADYTLGHPQYGVRPFDMAFVSGNVHAIRYAVMALAREKGALQGEGRARGKDYYRLAQHFAATFAPFVPGFGLDQVHLVKASLLKKMRVERLPSYEQCRVPQMHVRGDRLQPGETVLYVCHKWEGEDHPDPSGRTLRLVKRFLNGPEGRGIDYVYLDFCSLVAPAEGAAEGAEEEEGAAEGGSSATRAAQLQAVGAAAVLATHCLLVPPEGTVDVSEATAEEGDADVEDVGGREDRLRTGTAVSNLLGALGGKLGLTRGPVHKCSDLAGLLGGAWAKFGAVACMVTGADLWAHYLLEGHQDGFVQIPEGVVRDKDGTLAEGGYEAAAELALEHLGADGDLPAARAAVAGPWAVGEGQRPRDLLKDLVYAIMAFSRDLQMMVTIAKLGATAEDLARMRFQDATEEKTVEQIARGLGGLRDEGDRLVIARALLQLLAFCMDKVPLSDTERRVVAERADLATQASIKRFNLERGGLNVAAAAPADRDDDTMSVASFHVASPADVQRAKQQQQQPPAPTVSPTRASAYVQENKEGGEGDQEKSPRSGRPLFNFDGEKFKKDFEENAQRLADWLLPVQERQRQRTRSQSAAAAAAARQGEEEEEEANKKIVTIMEGEEEGAEEEKDGTEENDEVESLAPSDDQNKTNMDMRPVWLQKLFGAPSNTDLEEEEEDGVEEEEEEEQEPPQLERGEPSRRKVGRVQPLTGDFDDHFNEATFTHMFQQLLHATKLDKALDKTQKKQDKRLSKAIAREDPRVARARRASIAERRQSQNSPTVMG